MATYQQGVVIDGMTAIYGLAQRATKRNAVKIVTAPDENGEVADAVQFDPEANHQFEFIYDTETALPDLSAARTTPVTFEYDEDGSAGSGASVTYLVESVEDTEVNTEYRKVTLNCRRWTANGVPAASSGS